MMHGTDCIGVENAGSPGTRCSFVIASSGLVLHKTSRMRPTTQQKHTKAKTVGTMGKALPSHGRGVGDASAPSTIRLATNMFKERQKQRKERKASIVSFGFEIVRAEYEKQNIKKLS